MVPRTLIGAAAGALVLTAGGAQAAERATLTGELIDTWCYFSGVMGGPEAIVGTAHHTCALWCAAGGIPVGLLTDDGTVYMVLSFVGEAPGASETLLDLQSHEITVEATVYERDGLNYVTVENVVDDAGITKLSHEAYGVVPPMAIPEE